MITITVTSPSGDAGARTVRNPLAGPLLFVLGSVVGGATLGVTIGALTLFLQSPSLLASVGFVLAAFFWADRLNVARVRPPSTGWQVPRKWIGFGRLAYSLVFGLLLGMGIVTIATSWSLYVLLAWAAAQPSITVPIVILTVFGLVRSLPLLVIATGYHFRHFRIGSGIGIVEYFHAFPLSRSQQVFGHLETAAVAFAGGTSLHLVLGAFQ